MPHRPATECKCNTSSPHADTVSRVYVEPQVDIARYHMIEVQINLMNFSAVTIFLARVVERVTSMIKKIAL